MLMLSILVEVLSYIGILKFTPSVTKASRNIHWYSLTSLKSFEVMLEKS